MSATQAAPEGWRPAVASEVSPGDQVRVGGDGGLEVTVSRVEPSFLGRTDMIAFIEDTADRWLKVPVPGGAEVEVAR